MSSGNVVTADGGGDGAFLALGDSYTIGEGVAPAERWPAQLARLLDHEGLSIGEPAIIAKTGWTTDELSSAMEAAALDPPCALVTLLIGVNDQYRGCSPAQYRRGFTDLLRRAVLRAGSRPERVVVISIPDWGATPFARDEGRDPGKVAAAIDSFNAAARTAAEQAGCGWVDVTAISRSTEARAELAADGLHPSGAQYARWATAILPAARAALSAR